MGNTFSLNYPVLKQIAMSSGSDKLLHLRLFCKSATNLALYGILLRFYNF